MHIYHSLKPKQKQNPTSQYVGVSWDKKYEKWKAAISVNDRKKILGFFDDELEAARVYNDAAKKLGRDTLNFLPCVGD